ncbi:tetratricopeptide repeat protein [Kineococcus sp. NUM-3379]
MTTGRSSRPPERVRAEREPEPPLPEDVTGRELDPAAREALRGLAAPNALAVARHLVLAGRLVDEDPEQAWQHARAAQRRAGRIGMVREAAGIAAYRAGHFDAALAEFRAARRLTGDPAYLPIMADCERGLGRPERALELAGSAEARELDEGGRVEMLIVAAGARRDLGQAEAAVVALQGPELQARDRARPWQPRLWYAYADALEESGRAAEARLWFERAANADHLGETDADERLADLDGIRFSEEDAAVGGDAGASAAVGNHGERG